MIGSAQSHYLFSDLKCIQFDSNNSITSSYWKYIMCPDDKIQFARGFLNDQAFGR